MRRWPGSRLTYLSSGGTVYGRPQTEPIAEDHPCRPVVPYGVSRLAAEGYIAVYATLHGVRSRILRLGNVYGPTQPAGRRQGLIAALLAAAREGTAAEIWGDGRVARDYVHVEDVVDVVHRLPQPPKDPEILNVSTGVARTVADVVAAVEDATGETLRLRALPGRRFDVDRIALSTHRMKALIPYTPLLLEDGVRRTWFAQLAEAGDSGLAGSM
jgi:UDP-glucose 4-epimerase